MTPLKQQISLVPFSIEHWYSPYKRRHFENRWDQTFCILLIKDVLQTSADAKIWNKSDPDSNSDFRINLDPEVRRISVPKSWIHSSASFISPSLVQIGCWLYDYENWENREMLQMSENRLFLNGEENEKPESTHRSGSPPFGDPLEVVDFCQPLLEGHLFPVPAKFGRRPFPRSSVILFTEWQNEWKNDRTIT